MSVISGPDRAAEGSRVDADVPVRADGVELLGHMAGSGYRRPPALVRRSDGQTLQLTPLLYRVLEAVDGRRGYGEIAGRASAQFGRSITAENARELIESKLRPLGVLLTADGCEPDVRKANPLLALRYRFVVSNPRLTRRITAPFAVLFNPLVVLAVVVAFVLVCRWLLFQHGMAIAAHEAFARPGLLLAVFLITLVSAGFHEFGHAAAARYGGATPGAMGAGIYIAWPAFYTDVTDSYRLSRAGRIRTDLGGLYFNALLSVVVFGAWWGTGWDALLLVIGTQLIQMVRQLPPLIRFDGYHLLADVTGVPDLFHRIKPTLASLWPTRWRDPQATVLKPWVRAVVTLWVLVVVPVMLLTVLVTVLTLPRMIASAAAGLHRQWTEMTAAFGGGSVLTGLAKLLAVVAIALPVLGIGYLLVTTVRRLVRSVWRATEGRPVRRSAAGLVGALVAVALVLAWWPHGNYRAIQPYERGVLQDVVPAALHSDGPGLHEGRLASATTVWPADAGPLPTSDKPALSLVLVPRDTSAPTWVFPFNRPALPGPGGNQALAVNTKNGTAVYDVAFALVWADGDTVLNRNEAYAFASCTRCTAVAVSFQVVLIVGHASVIAPQNIAAAVNYNCVECVTQALAVQLVITLPNEPTAAEKHDLAALWAQIQEFSKHLRGLSFAQIHARLVQYEARIAAVVQKYAPPTGPSPSATSGVAVTTAGTGSGGSSSSPAAVPEPAGPTTVGETGAASTVESTAPASSPAPVSSDAPVPSDAATPPASAPTSP